MAGPEQQSNTDTPQPQEYSDFESSRRAAGGGVDDYDDVLGEGAPPPSKEPQQAAPSQEETPGEGQADAEPQSADDGDRQPDEEPGKSPKADLPKGVKDRLNRQNRKHKRETDAYKARIEALEAQLKEAKGESEGKPEGEPEANPEPPEEEQPSSAQQPDSEADEDDIPPYPERRDYESDEEYAAATAAWDERVDALLAEPEPEPAKETKAETPKQEQEESPPQPQAASQNEVMQVYHQNLLEMLDDHDAESESNSSLAEDFERLRQEGRLSVTPTMLERMATDDEAGVEIAQMLIELPRLSREVAVQNPDQQNARIDRLLEKRRTRLAGGGPTSRDATDLPAPSPLRGNGNAPQPTLREAAENNDFREYERLRSQQDRDGEDYSIGV